MKKGLLFSILAIIFSISSALAGNGYAGSKLSGDTTVTFAVNGNAACKSNIEAALTANANVVSASWDATAKMITVTFHTANMQITDLYPILANAGYDNAEQRAKDGVYAALPTSCQYTRDPVTE